MSFDKPKVTIDLDEYNKLLNAEKVYEQKQEANRSEFDKLQIRSREFVSALSFLEDKGLLDEFNAKINQKYRLELTGGIVKYKKLVLSCATK